MKIFRFYPALFQRMYFVAPSMEVAQAMSDVVFAQYLAEESGPLWGGEDEEEVRQIRDKFDIGFAALEEHPLAFLDANY